MKLITLHKSSAIHKYTAPIMREKQSQINEGLLLFLPWGQTVIEDTQHSKCKEMFKNKTVAFTEFQALHVIPKIHFYCFKCFDLYFRTTKLKEKSEI